MPSEDTRQLFVSDEAWEHLIQLAKDEKYIKPDARNAAGIDNFIEYLMSQSPADDRPEDVKEQDEFMLEVGMAPEWVKYTPRKKRTIRVSYRILIAACVHAHSLNISSVNPRTGAPAPFDGNKCLSILLEATGTGWITWKNKTDQTTKQPQH